MMWVERSLLLLFLSLAVSAWGLDNITISGNPSPMTINSATAGSQPTSVVDASTTYRVSTLLFGRKITGQLNNNTPTGVTLSLQLQAPLGATSQGSLPLSTTPVDLVTSLPLITILTGPLQMIYTLSATVAASSGPVQNVTLTLTIL